MKRMNSSLMLRTPSDAGLGCITECVTELVPRVRAPQLEWRALSMVRGLSVQVRTACAGVVSSTQGLPSAVQEQLSSARRTADQLHSSLRDTSVLSPPLLEQSRQQLTQVLMG